MASELAKILADFRTQLTAKISVGGTSGAIQTNTDDDGVTIPNGTYYFTIDGDNSQKEYIKCTLTGLNMTDIKSVSRQGTITAGTVREHRVGAIVTVTDFGIIKKMLDLLDGTTDLDGSNPLKYDADPTITDNKELCTKKYADDLAIAGSPKATDSVYGITKLSTPAVDPLQPIAVGDNDTRVPTQDENDAQAGTSGTPSTTNKYVTENDTSNFATITAATISFTASTKTIADSGSGLAIFRAGSSIAITGSASNNGTFTIISVLAGSIVVAETLTDESASATVVMTTVSASKIVRRKSDSNITVPTTPTAGTDSASKSYVDSLANQAYQASDNLISGMSADTERSTDSSTYIKVKEILIGKPGIFRVKFDLKGSSASGYGRIYKNGVAYGTEQFNGNNTFTKKSEDLAFGAGDLLQLYYHGTSGNITAYVKNLRVYGTLTNGNVVITD